MHASDSHHDAAACRTCVQVPGPFSRDGVPGAKLGLGWRAWWQAPFPPVSASLFASSPVMVAILRVSNIGGGKLAKEARGEPRRPGRAG